MGCLKILHNEQKSALNESWKIFVGGVEKTSSSEKNRINYYPFGMVMPGRSSNSSSYNYGYQGSEKDDEISGSGNSYTTFYRGLDPRLGRWKSIDPKATAWESPYVSMGNSPILWNDVLGDTAVTSERREADLIVNDLNGIYSDKYGDGNYFEVVENTRKVVEEGWLWFDDEVTYETEYVIATVYEGEFDWNEDQYSAALFDALNSRDIVEYSFSAVSDSKMKDILGHSPQRAMYNNDPVYTVSIYGGHSKYSDLKSKKSQYTFGGIFMHETLYHKTSLGPKLYKEANYTVHTTDDPAPNKIYNFYGLKTTSGGSLHKAGMSIPWRIGQRSEQARLQKLRENSCSSGCQN